MPRREGREEQSAGRGQGRSRKKRKSRKVKILSKKNKKREIFFLFFKRGGEAISECLKRKKRLMIIRGEGGDF